jgi:hypothetical protein
MGIYVLAKLVPLCSLPSDPARRGFAFKPGWTVYRKGRSQKAFPTISLFVAA